MEYVTLHRVKLAPFLKSLDDFVNGGWKPKTKVMTMADQTETRGERNNNPGNIRRTQNLWRGEIQPGADDRFCQFETAHYGLRALARILINYQLHDNCLTVRQIINRWAPPVENDTSKYVDDVAKWLDVDPDATFSVGADTNLSDLMRAIIRQENGRCIYPLDAIDRACNAATEAF